MRYIQEQFSSKLKSSKLLLLEGPKNSGKRFFVEDLLHQLDLSSIFIDCKESKNSRLEGWITDPEFAVDVLVLEAAEYLPELEILIDELLNGRLKQRVLLLCSFKLQLSDEFMAALRVEQMAFYLYSPVFYERSTTFGLPKEMELIDERLIYGSYPHVIADLPFAELNLRELVNDVISTHPGLGERMNKGVQLLRLLQHLAFEIGEPVSYHELGMRCRLDNETVERYINMLTAAHLLIKLPVFSSGKRYELKKSFCFYFFDNGIRNALINNFNPPFLRNDMEVLWRNYLISERIKWTRMLGKQNEFWFWRSHTGQQIDLIEMNADLIHAYVSDWENRKKTRFSPLFTKYYPQINCSSLNKKTFVTFLGKRS